MTSRFRPHSGWTECRLLRRLAYPDRDGQNFEELLHSKNPIGTLIEKSELACSAGFIAERGGVLLVDEIYQGLVYGTEPWCLNTSRRACSANTFAAYCDVGSS